MHDSPNPGTRLFSRCTEAVPGRSSGVAGHRGSRCRRKTAFPVAMIAWSTGWPGSYPDSNGLNIAGAPSVMCPGCGHAGAPPVSAIQPNRQNDGYLCYLWGRCPEIAARNVQRVPRCLVSYQPVSRAGALAYRTGHCFGHIAGHTEGPLPAGKGP